MTFPAWPYLNGALLNWDVYLLAMEGAKGTSNLANTAVRSWLSFSRVWVVSVCL